MKNPTKQNITKLLETYDTEIKPLYENHPHKGIFEGDDSAVIWLLSDEPMDISYILAADDDESREYLPRIHNLVKCMNSKKIPSILSHFSDASKAKEAYIVALRTSSLHGDQEAAEMTLEFFLKYADDEETIEKWMTADLDLFSAEEVIKELKKYLD